MCAPSETFFGPEREMIYGGTQQCFLDDLTCLSQLLFSQIIQLWAEKSATCYILSKSNFFAAGSNHINVAHMVQDLGCVFHTNHTHGIL